SLIATSSSSERWRAAHTSPIAPVPSFRSSSYLSATTSPAVRFGGTDAERISGGGSEGLRIGGGRLGSVSRAGAGGTRRLGVFGGAGMLGKGSCSEVMTATDKYTDWDGSRTRKIAAVQSRQAAGCANPAPTMGAPARDEEHEARTLRAIRAAIA